VTVIACALLGISRVSTQSAAGKRTIEIVGGHEAVAGEALVRFRDDRRSARRLDALDVQSDQPVAHGLRRLRARGRRAADLIASLSARPDVAFVEPNYVIRPSSRVPNDPYFYTLWAFLNKARPGADISATAAWGVTTGSKDNVIALIDTGVDYTHPDLAANIWSAPASFSVTIGGTVVTCPAGSHGFNALAMNCEPRDDFGHGTAMAGLMGAVGNNGIGISGVNWNASIMAIKFLGADGWGSYADAINAIEFAVQTRAAFSGTGAANIRILSNSWAGTAFSQTLLDEITRAGSAGMLFVASAGNADPGLAAADDDVTPHYPASYDAANILSVAATTQSDTLDPISNYGQKTIDLGAPALDYSTALGNTYAATGGTSSATAIVAGAAALLLSQCDLSVAALKKHLIDGTDPLGSLQGVTVAGGRLNVGRSLDACRGGNSAPFVTLLSPNHLDTFTSPADIVISADASDADGSIAKVEFYANTTLIGSDATAPYSKTWRDVPPGVYALTAVATDDRGATSRTSELRTVLVEAPTADVPLPWKTQDIGAVGLAGDTSYADGSFTVQGSGTDIWGTGDQFRYVYQPLKGDGDIVARVSFVEGVQPWTKAGVMMRETLTAGSAHAAMFVSAGKGLAYQRRTSTGGLTTHTGGDTGSAPYWLRLTRSGSTITASESGDGVTWTVVGRDTFSMTASVYVGLAVTSHTQSSLAMAIVDSVSVTTGPVSTTPPSVTPWSDTDIGAVGVRGSMSAGETTITVNGAGADVWGTADSLNFAYQPLTGDGQIVARVASLGNVEAWTKAGVMIRGSLDAGAAQAFMLVSSGKGLAFQRRPSPGGLSVSTAAGAGAAPNSIRLTRHGAVVTASRSANGTTWTTIGDETLALGETAYVGLAVSSHDTAHAATAVFDHVAMTSTAAALPSGWRAADIGSGSPQGSTTAAGGTFTLQGRGDVWGSADGAHFTYTTLESDGEIVARVATVENVNAWTKAGVMIRQSLEPGSAQALMLVSPGKGLAFQRRIVRGGLTTNTAGGGGTAPYWVRISRSGSSVTAAKSIDGITWTTVGHDTLSLSGTVYIGLAVSSHDSTSLATATFTNVRVRPLP
jgi:regulation of enolase protein 1 (concanavalin A-like superfamily)